MAISNLTLAAIEAEGHSQDLKWGEQNGPPTEWLAILVEEVGELAQAILADHSATPEMHDSHHVSMETEAIQIVVVAAHFIEYLSRRKLAES
jgi:NTP pyrophosphatase (non-canonical NTP hydrolase)